jgi:hypothetical protein
MSINSNIIFTVGSKLGPGGFASLKAGIDMLVAIGNKIVEITEDLDKSAQAWERTNKAAVVMADTAAAGLIDTGVIVKEHNALMRAGVKITDEQFKTIAVRTVELAQATGQDATEAFKRLTTSIKTGSTRALREYGVDLKTSGTLTEKQTDAVKKLTEGFEDLTVSAQTSTERLFALKNNIGTLATTLWSESGSSDTVAFALDEVNTALGDFNKELAESPKRMREFVASGQFMKGFIAEYKLALIDLASAKFIEIERGEQGGLLATMSRLFFGTEKPKGKGTFEQWTDDVKKGLKSTAQEVADFYRNLKDTIEEDPITGTGPLPPMGAGGPAAPGITDEELISGFGAMDKTLAAEQAFFDEMGKEREEALKAARDAEAEAEQMALFESLDRQEIYFAELDRLEEESYSRSLSNLEMFFGVEQEALAQSNKQWQSGLQGKANMAATFFGAIAQLQNTESEKLFNIGKAGAIAEGLINTYLGAIKAYQSFAGLGPWGIALGAVAAAAVTAAGLANVARIRAQKFKGGESGGAIAAPTISGGSAKSIGGLAGASGAPPGVGPGAGSPGGPLKQEITVNIRMQDDAGAAMFNVVMDENDRADRDGRRSLTPMGRAA